MSILTSLKAICRCTKHKIIFDYSLSVHIICQSETKQCIIRSVFYSSSQSFLQLTCLYFWCSTCQCNFFVGSRVFSCYFFHNIFKILCGSWIIISVVILSYPGNLSLVLQFFNTNDYKEHRPLLQKRNLG